MVSEYFIGEAQEDGRVYVTEMHTFDDGKQVTLAYLADPDTNFDERLLTNATSLQAEREREEREARLSLTTASLQNRVYSFARSFTDAELVSHSFTTDEIALLRT